MHTGKKSGFAVLCHIADSNPLPCICQQILGSRQMSMFLCQVICVELDICCSPPQGYVNLNVIFWPDIGYIGLASGHFTRIAFYKYFEKGLVLSPKHSRQKKRFRHCNLAFKNNLSNCTM